MAQQFGYGQNLPPGLGVPAHLQQLFQRVDNPLVNAPYSRVQANQFGPSIKAITQGSLIHFSYTNYKHDPHPLIIVTKIGKNYIYGINLHYLTFNYIKKLLRNYSDNVMFSYATVKADAYLVSAYRMYRRTGVKRPNKLDSNFLLNVLGTVRSFDPAEIEQMRVYIRQQLRRQGNPKAQAAEERYMGQINPQG